MLVNSRDFTEKVVLWSRWVAIGLKARYEPDEVV